MLGTKDRESGVGPKGTAEIWEEIGTEKGSIMGGLSFY